MSARKSHNAAPADAGPTPEQLLAAGSATATNWLWYNAGRAWPISAAVCRALRLADMVLTHEASPAFPYLLAAWEEGFDLTLRAAATATTGHGHAAAPTTSVFEDRFEQFTDCPMTAHVGAVPLMRDLNRVATNSAGFGTVLSIVAGIIVAQGNFNLDDPDSAPPLN